MGSKTFLCVLVAGASVFAQPTACGGYTVTVGWDESGPASMLGGGSGPEDVAYNPMTQRVYVLPTSTSPHSRFLNTISSRPFRRQIPR